MTTGVLHREHDAASACAPLSHEVSFAAILIAVGVNFGFSSGDLTRVCRRTRFAHPRMVVMFLARRLCVVRGAPMSFPNIAGRLGLKYHDAVMHGVDRVGANLAFWLGRAPVGKRAKDGCSYAFKVTKADFMAICERLGVNADEL